MRDGFFHDARGFDDLGQEHLAAAKQVADDIHPVHQRPFDHLNRATPCLLNREPRFFSVVNHMRVDAFDKRMFEPLIDLPAAPFGLSLFHRRINPTIFLGERDEIVGGFVFTVKDYILARIAQGGFDIVINIELTCVHNRHIKPNGDRVIKEHAVHRAAHSFITPETERQVR